MSKFWLIWQQAVNNIKNWVVGKAVRSPGAEATMANPGAPDGTELPNYPWYAVPMGRQVTQGDILFNCPVIAPVSGDQVTGVSEGGRVALDVTSYTVVVMTQACDIEEDRVDDIIVCPLAPDQGAASDSADRSSRGTAT